MRRVVSVPILVLALLMAACGSGGGGAGAAPAAAPEHPYALLQGEYHLAGIAGEQMGAETITSYWGTLSADGSGGSTLEGQVNELGTQIGPLPPAPVDYEVDLDRVLSLASLLPGIPSLRGAVTEAGDVAAVASARTGPQPLVFFFGRREGTFDDASLSGVYRFAGYGGNVLATLNFVDWGAFTFDGSGGGAYETSTNQEGAMFGPANPLCSYAVAGDGAVAVTLAGGYVLTGQVVAGGELVLLSGGPAAGDNPRTYVLLRQGTGYSDADLVGDYFMLGFAHDPATNAYIAFTGAMQADGAGSNLFAGIRCTDGVATHEPIDGMTSAVAPDGAVTFTTAGGDTLEGGMSSDRRFVVAAGASNAGGPPVFFFFLR